MNTNRICSAVANGSRISQLADGPLQLKTLEQNSMKGISDTAECCHL